MSKEKQSSDIRPIIKFEEAGSASVTHIKTKSMCRTRQVLGLA
jgi:hypothetical protein